MTPQNENLNNKPPLLGCSRAQIQEAIHSYKQPTYRGNQIFKWIHYHNIDSFEEMSNIPKKFRLILSENFTIKNLQLADMKIATDGTEKYLWKLLDNRHIESVLIPEKRRNTICISSQVGCSLQCHFCATGTMGLLRNLTPGEIVEQVLQVNKLSQNKITNIVFMGMGEPFMNYPRVIQACQILGDPEGTAISNRRITISTSGVIPKIYQYTDDKLPFGLAISLHAPEQKLREQIMPIASKFPLDLLLNSIKYYMRAKKRNRVTFEYVLLHGINDTPVEARKLISLLSPIRCKLNLIPCNQNNLGYNPPPQDALQKFMEVIMNAPFAVTLRKNRGEDITAACGQLAVEVEEKAIFMKV